MSDPKRLPRLITALFLVFVTNVVTFVLPVAAQTGTAPATSAAPQDYSAQLAAIEEALEKKRVELGIPGMSLAIVKDDRVILMKGFGLKNIEQKIPVTADTLFAIGSSSKAFTGMIALMSADSGKLSLDDSPKKFLPYFKLRDPDADSKITIRDLLSHRSGLNRTDLAMVSGKLNREELIEVAASAKATAKLGEKFQYQNVMYTAAGEAVARAENSTWDKLIASKIFQPLGMKSSDTTVEEMQKARDFSFGYEYNAATKETRKLPQREIGPAAPAGAINSSARDMAQWIRFMLAGGVYDGKRLVSEKSFNEALAKQMKVAGTVDYGLGWFLRDWNKHKVTEHGGNIDGFNAQVALMPDQKLGFVLLTNVTASSIGTFAMTTIWKNLVGEPAAEKTAGPATDPKLEVGTYTLVQAGMNFEVTIKDDKLTLTVPGQPAYPLESLGGRKYKLGDPAPAGFYATFRPIQGKETETELFLEQPQGNAVLPKRTVAAATTPTTTSVDAGPLSVLVGSYESELNKRVIEIGVRDGKVSLVVPGQPPYPLTESEKDKLRSPGLPETYWIDIKRGETGKVSALVLNQPEGSHTFRRLLGPAELISVDELIAKVIAGYGGEANMRKHKSSVATIVVDMENQGVQADGTITLRAPNASASEMKLKALGKEIGWVISYFDGQNGGEVISFAPEEVYSGRRLEDVRTGSDFYDVLNWKQNYKSITVKRLAKVNDEDVYVVERKSEKGTPVTDYISAKTFLIVKRDSVVVSETSGVELPQTQVFSDYRNVDGVMVAHKMVSNNIANGDIVILVKDIKWDVAIPDSLFKKPVAKK